MDGREDFGRGDQPKDKAFEAPTREYKPPQGLRYAVGGGGPFGVWWRSVEMEGVSGQLIEARIATVMDLPSLYFPSIQLTIKCQSGEVRQSYLPLEFSDTPEQLGRLAYLRIGKPLNLTILTQRGFLPAEPPIEVDVPFAVLPDHQEDGSRGERTVAGLILDIVNGEAERRIEHELTAF